MMQIPRKGLNRTRRPLITTRLQRRIFILFGQLPSLFILAFYGFPIIYVLYLSFLKWNPALGGSPIFVGLENYRTAFTKDDLFWNGVWNTLKFPLIRLPIAVPISLLIAIGLNTIPVSRRGVLTSAYFAPVVSSMTGVSLVFLYLYDPKFGLFNQILTGLGLPPLRFLYSQSQAIPSIAAVDIWKGLGFGMIMYLAGLQGIPSEIYDAARVDGANVWGLLRHITLPFLWPVTTLILVMDFRYTIQMFTPIYMLTGGTVGLGGPLNSTRTLMLLIYQKAFAAFQLSYASALSVILAVIILIFAIIQTRLGRQRWEL